MSARTDLDLTTIESLEFQPPCDSTELWPSGRVSSECASEAVWIVVYENHYCTPGTRTRLLCDEHMAYYTAPNAIARCHFCLEVTAARRIISIERIGR